jgi:hypothetical protein
MSEIPSTNADDLHSPPNTIQRIRTEPASASLPRLAARPAQSAESSGTTPDSTNPNPLGAAPVDALTPGAAHNSDFFTRNIEPRPEIIRGLIREQELGLIAGTYGVGKSPLVSQIVTSVLNGIRWCGREVCQRSVIAFDLESAGPTYKRNLVNAAERFHVPPPRVPAELEAYVEHDSATEPGTAKLLEFLKFSDLDCKIACLAEMLGRKPNALVIIDPLELLFRVDTRDKMHVIDLYRKLRLLLTHFPHAAILFTVNLRKKDRRAQYSPDLLTDPRGWLEDVSGSLDILNRCDVRLGMDFCGNSELRVINGIRRGEELHPLLIQPVCVDDDSDRPAGFELVSANAAQLVMALPGKLEEYWNKLETEFTFDQATTIMGKSNFNRLKNRTMSLGVLKQVARGRYKKVSEER